MCKHLMLLLAMLMKDGVVSGRTGLTKYYNANYKQFIKSNEKQRMSQENMKNNILKSYKKDHRIMNEQRNLTHYISGNKVERVKFNS